MSYSLKQTKLVNFTVDRGPFFYLSHTAIARIQRYASIENVFT